MQIYETEKVPCQVGAVKKVGDAKYRCYAKYRHGTADKHVIHSVGPDLRTGMNHSEAEAALSLTYQNILSEFASSGTRVLRLLPVGPLA